MTPEEARKAIDSREGERVEFKASIARVADAVVALGAMANRSGGTVFFGIEPNGNIVGQQVGGRTLEKIAQQIKDDSDPTLQATIEPIDLGLHNPVIAVTVEPAQPAVIHLVKGCAKVRVGRSNQPMDFTELRSRLSGAAAADVRPLHWESRARGERGLIIQNFGTAVATDVIGEIARPNGGQAWKLTALGAGQTRGLTDDTALPADPLGEPTPPAIPGGRYGARVQWIEPDGTVRTTDWVIIHKQ